MPAMSTDTNDPSHAGKNVLLHWIVRATCNPALQGVLVVAFALLVYFPVMFNRFTSDADLLVVSNPHLLRSGFVSACFSGEYFNVSAETTYRPVTTLAYWLILKIFGLSPAAFHVIAILMHALAAFMVIKLFQRLGLDRWALLGGTGFALHPILTEPVCGIGFLGTLFAAFFVLTGIHAAIRACCRDTKTAIRILLALACGLCLLTAAFADKSGVMLAALFPLLVILFPDRFESKKGVLACSAALFLSACFYGFTYFAGPQSRAPELTVTGGSISQALLNYGIVSAKYVGWMFCPFELSIDRPADPSAGIGTPGVWALTALTVIILAAGLIAGKRSPAATAGILWFYAVLALCACCSPSLQNDRYFYLPSVGFFLALSSTAGFLSRKSRGARTGLLVLSTLLVVTWAMRTSFRVAQWHDNDVLWSHELTINPANTRALIEISAEANRCNRFDLARDYAARALVLAPSNAFAEVNLADALFLLFKHEEALPIYLCAVSRGTLHPFRLSGTWQNIAKIYDGFIHDTNAAKSAFARVLDLDPYCVDAALALGNLHLESGETNKALAVWYDALRKSPGNSALQYTIGLVQQSAPEPAREPQPPGEHRQ